MAFLDSSTSALVRLALDAASLRHMALADNIANAGSPGHAPKRVSFEEQLGQARQALAAGRHVQPADLAGVGAFVEQRPAPNTGQVAGALDLELVRLAQNTLQYQALLRASSRFTTIMASAISDGRS